MLAAFEVVEKDDLISLCQQLPARLVTETEIELNPSLFNAVISYRYADLESIVEEGRGNLP